MTNQERIRAELRVLDECVSCIHVREEAERMCAAMQIPCEFVALGLVEHMGRLASCARYEWRRG